MREKFGLSDYEEEEEDNDFEDEEADYQNYDPESGNRARADVDIGVNKLVGNKALY